MRPARWLAFAALAVIGGAAPSAASATTSVTLSWTSPGDDGRVGTAAQYSIRYSPQPITEANFWMAAPVAGLPLPRAAGASERFTATGLPDFSTMYFAIKTRDEAGNWSPISNVVKSQRSTVGNPPPSVVLSFSAPMPNPATGATRFALTLPEAAGVYVEVFDIRGRRIRVIADQTYSAGQWDVPWDLRDASGSPVGAGVYLVRAHAQTMTWSRSVVVLN